MFQKFLIMIVIILIVWYGFKWFDRIKKLKGVSNKHSVTGDNHDERAVYEMIQCADCGAYVPDDGQHKCG